MSLDSGHYEHKASLPWCCYDKNAGKIALRLRCPENAGAAALISGDPYDWRDSGGKEWAWRFDEQPMALQYSGSGAKFYRIEIEPPPSRRLKYGFRVGTPEGEVYYSENGAEPYSAEAAGRSHNHFVYPFVHDLDAPDAPGWVQDTVWYQIFPDRFCRNEASVPNPPVKLSDWNRDKPEYRTFFGGNLAGIKDRLPRLADLGFSGVYLTPVFKSPSTHKYDTEDYFAVDPLFGSLDDLKALVREAHRLNIRVMLDAVFNHAGDSHPFWRDVIENQEKSRYKDYFHVRRFPIRPFHMLPSREDMDFHAFAYFARMPKWNTENPEARKYLLDAAQYWIKECGIDGWRLDVANEVSFDFWKAFSRAVRPLKKDFYLVGEVWHDASPWINSGLFDAVMNYPLGSAVSDCFLKRELEPEAFTARVFSVLARYGDIHSRLFFNLLDSHDTDRALTRAGGDKLALKNAFIMLFLLPGSPCVYYGTETGMEGGRDPDCRRPMVWDAALQDGELVSFFKRLLEFRRKHLDIINGAAVHYSGGEAHVWDFSCGGGRLSAVYTGERGVSGFEVPGACAFGPEEPLSRYESGEIPPRSLVVFKRREA